MATEQEQKTDPIVVTIGGETYKFKLPGYAERYELCVGWADNKIRGSAAILGVCLPGLMRPGQTYDNHGCNAMRYGRAVWDVLRGRGVEEVEIIEAAGPLYARLAESTFPADVEDRAVFT